MDIQLISILNKKTILYFSLLIVIITLFFIKIYYTYYFIDISNFKEIKHNGTYFSPNEEYSISISLVKLRDKEDEYYILGELTKIEFIDERNQLINDKNTHIVYWDKKQGSFNQNTIYVRWINNTQFQIENKKLNIFFKNYDYRRDIRKI